MTKDMMKEAVMSTPPVSIAALSMGGVSLSDWVYILTIIWLMSQIAWFGYKRIRDWGKDTDDE